jgi:ribosomal subunit interface protein
MKIRITSHGFVVTGEFEKYINSKLIDMTKQIPRKLRPNASCQLHFTQTRKDAVKFNTCSITVMIDDTELKAKETTQHMYAALDVAVVHLEHQLRAYAAAHRTYRIRGRLRWPSQTN